MGLTSKQGNSACLVVWPERKNKIYCMCTKTRSEKSSRDKFMRKIEALGQDDAGVRRWERENIEVKSGNQERLELLHASGMCFKKSNLPIWVHSKDDRQ